MAYTPAKDTLGLTQPQQINPSKISFAAKDADLIQWKGDLLAVGATEKDVAKGDNNHLLNATLNKLDSWLHGELSLAISEESFSGKSGQVTTLSLLPSVGPRRISLIGLGSPALIPTSYQSFGDSIATLAKSSQATSVAVGLALPEEIPLDKKPRVAWAIATGIILGTSDDNRYKRDAKPVSLKSVDIFGLGTSPDVEKMLKYVQALSWGIIFARQLVNDPANVLTPEVLSRHAEKIAKDSDVLSVKILDSEQCKDLKMGAYLGVAAGATANPSRFIHIIYKTNSRERKTRIAVIGKAITFDSGGYNIKIPSAGADIENMKNDMGGAAAVIAAAKVIAEMRPFGVEVHFIAPACENMISDLAYRPGDILTASNGKTIEITNTDAEGRLALADALVYACNLGVEKIVDLATLTGACTIALGPAIAGVFSPNEELAKEVFLAAEASGEKLWRLPMEESYWELMKSHVADMSNSAPRGSGGGATTAALFLKQFVKENIQWLHIDIAGSVRIESTKLGTGFGVATLVEWLAQPSPTLV